MMSTIRQKNDLCGGSAIGMPRASNGPAEVLRGGVWAREREQNHASGNGLPLFAGHEWPVRFRLTAVELVSLGPGPAARGRRGWRGACKLHRTMKRTTKYRRILGL